MLTEAEKVFEEVMRLNACIGQYNNIFLVSCYKQAGFLHTN